MPYIPKQIRAKTGNKQGDTCHPVQIQGQASGDSKKRDSSLTDVLDARSPAGGTILRHSGNVRNWDLTEEVGQ